MRWEPLHGEAWRLAWLEMELVSVYKEPHLDHEDRWQSINEKKQSLEKGIYILLYLKKANLHYYAF